MGWCGRSLRGDARRRWHLPLPAGAFSTRAGKLMPFLFIWTIVLTIPLIMATGIIGMEQYLGYFFPGLSYWPMHLIGAGVTAAIVLLLLYRGIESVKAINTALWVITLLAAGLTIAASYSNFHPGLAFHYPHNAFGGGFVAALGAGLLIAIYGYLGYNTVAYMGGELRNPGIRWAARRVAGAIPRGTPGSLRAARGHHLGCRPPCYRLPRLGRYHYRWPFGGKETNEEFLQNQRGHPERAASPDTGG
jgi:amino acid transporter